MNLQPYRVSRDAIFPVSAELHRDAGGQCIYECVREPDETHEAFFERFRRLPFVHSRQVSAAEFHERYGDGHMEPKP